MADFNKAIVKVLKKEGGYAYNPADRGGETYKGISRKYHGNSPMWAIIDKLKNDCDGVNAKFKSRLDLNEEVDAEVKKIYKTYYWDKFKLDNVPNQKVAEQIFDDAVNRGVGAACKLCCTLLELPVTTTPNKKLISLLQTL